MAGAKFTRTSGDCGGRSRSWIAQVLTRKRLRIFGHDSAGFATGFCMNSGVAGAGLISYFNN
jgi:hypothetical protein